MKTRPTPRRRQRVHVPAEIITPMHDQHPEPPPLTADVERRVREELAKVKPKRRPAPPVEQPAAAPVEPTTFTPAIEHYLSQATRGNVRVHRPTAPRTFEAPEG